MTDYLRDRVTFAVGDRYLIEDEIGRGGMSVVFRAVDLRLHRPVAIKVLPPELAFNPDVRERFLREAQTAAQLAHPNIVPIYAVDEHDGIVYFAMAFVEGDSVAALLARQGAFGIATTVRVLHDVADALVYAHAHGVVHRDIKPDNILIERATGRPLVTDFGIARAAMAATRITATGVAMGTPAYMSPEQAMGERDIDGRSDIYSLGAVGYQMLAGEPPFKAASTPAMLVKHVSERPRPVRERRPDVPAYVAVVVDRALAKRPEDRWQDAGELRDALANRSMVRYTRRREPAHSPAPDHGRMTPDAYDDRPLEERVIAFRRSMVRALVVGAGALGLNAAMAGIPWFLFVWVFLALDVLRKGGSIWSDGIGPVEAFRKGIRSRLRGEPLPRPVAPAALPASRSKQPEVPAIAAWKLEASPEVARGPYGGVVRRAATDAATIHDVVVGLRPVERDMIPDVMPTVEALAARIVSLATTLHRLDADVSGSSLGALDDRIAVLRSEQATLERDQRLSLLERQRASLHDLLERRRSLANQLESTGLALQNLKLDLLKLRSSGLGSALEDVTSATQEARALSRDISSLLDASDDLRKL